MRSVYYLPLLLLLLFLLLLQLLFLVIYKEHLILIFDGGLTIDTGVL